MSTASGCAAIIRSFKLDLEVSGLSKSTVSHYVRDVSRFLGWCESVSVSHNSVGSYREYLASISGLFSAKTIYEVQLALRKYIRFSYQEGMVSKDFSKTIKLRSTATHTIPSIGTRNSSPRRVGGKFTDPWTSSTT